MLINLKQSLDDKDIQEIIGYSVFPDPDKLEITMEAYRSDESLNLYGIESEGEILGIIGFRLAEGNQLIIEHIAVQPDYRGMDFGRGLILEAINLIKPSEVVAETDDEAVNFYRSIGFQIESLGDKYPGVERFRCTYHTEIG